MPVETPDPAKKFVIENIEELRKGGLINEIFFFNNACDADFLTVLERNMVKDAVYVVMDTVSEISRRIEEQKKENKENQEWNSEKYR